MTTADATGRGGEPTDEGTEHGPELVLSPDDITRDELGAEPLDTAQLAFAEDEVRLPWLESDDDDDEGYPGYNTGQVVALFIIGLLALAVIGGGIWWAVGQRRDNVQVASGGIIAAPGQPYKERPKNPGGKTFAGTGDTSFAVSEGQTRPAKLGESPEAKPAAQPSPKPSAAAPAEETGGVGVQVAAYSNRAQAEAGWTRLSGQYEALASVKHRVVEGQADIGTVYRLQAVAPDARAAHALCGQLKSVGLACQVKN
jgi:hypothetical protein